MFQFTKWVMVHRRESKQVPQSSELVSFGTKLPNPMGHFDAVLVVSAQQKTTT